MRHDQVPARVTHPIPKGTLWTRGLALAEAEIGRGVAPVGRWSLRERAAMVLHGTTAGGPEDRFLSAGPGPAEVMEEESLRGMAA